MILPDGNVNGRLVKTCKNSSTYLHWLSQASGYLHYLQAFEAPVPIIVSETAYRYTWVRPISNSSHDPHDPIEVRFPSLSHISWPPPYGKPQNAHLRLQLYL